MNARLVSALVLGPAVLGIIWLGGVAFYLLLFVAGALMAYEYWRLIAPDHVRILSSLHIAVMATALGVMILMPETGVAAPVGILIAGCIAMLGFVLGARARLWSPLGMAYLILPLLIALWIHRVPDGGALFLLWIVLLVWTSDSAAYFVGRSIGGPKLAPSISPAKTWSGALGGIGGALVLALICAAVLDTDPLYTALLGIYISIAAQLGDLLESFVKRRTGVKDTGALIPGHGGMLDRLDGVLLALIAFVPLDILLSVEPV